MQDAPLHIDLQITNHSEEEWDFDEALEYFLLDPMNEESKQRCSIYPPDLEQAIDRICREEYKKTLSDSFFLTPENGHVGINMFGTCLSHNEPAPQAPTAQARAADALLWTIRLWDQVAGEVPLAVYLFYRDPLGDIRKLHTDRLEITAPVADGADKGDSVRIHLSRQGSDTLDCGRYYMVVRLLDDDNLPLDRPFAVCLNILPPTDA